MKKPALSSQFLRFCIVGAINTSVDVIIFTALRMAGTQLVLANICSTSVGITISFLLNYRYTFHGKTVTRSKITTYVIVTLIGLWAIQPLIITLLMAANNQFSLTLGLINTFGHARLINTVLPKIGSIAVTLVWNYLWYSRVIFKKERTSEQVGIAIEDA